jgi:N6-adenosine-specific RNA methylase IME4
MQLEFHPLADIFPLIEGIDFTDLVNDIRQNGLHEPIVLYRNQILDGRNRYRGCLAAGVEPNFTKYTGSDPLGYVISLNLKRRHLDESQRALVAARIAKLRLGDNQHSEGLPIGRASELLNVGERTTARAREVLDRGTAALVGAVERGQVSVSAAADVATLPEQEQVEIVARGEREILKAASEIRARKAEARRAERIEKLIAISNHNAPLAPDRRYPVIYADPPWLYEHPPMGGNRVIENHYPTLTLEEICALPVAEISTEDAILFMWATSPKLSECMDVIKAWDFDYRTSVVWVKDKIGMGYYVRNQHEFLLIAKRGDPPMPAEGDRQSSVVEAPRTEHSAKPNEFYELIERMYPDLPKIELFARQDRAIRQGVQKGRATSLVRNLYQLSGLILLSTARRCLNRSEKTTSPILARLCDGRSEGVSPQKRVHERHERGGIGRFDRADKIAVG